MNNRKAPLHQSGNEKPQREQEQPQAPSIDVDTLPRTSQEEGPPRALGSQTDIGDQTELEGTGDQPPSHKEKGRDETLKHSNSSTHHAAYKTRAGERDVNGLHGG